MTPGRRALLGIPDAAIAEATGARPSTIRNWRAGSRTPDLLARAQLSAAFGIPIDAWEIVAPATRREPILLVVPTPIASRLRKAGVDALSLLTDALDALEQRKDLT